IDVLHLALVEVGLLDLVLRPDAVDGYRTGLKILELELQDRPPVPGRVQVAVHHVIELAVLADEDHALADLTVFDRSHDNLRLQYHPTSTLADPETNVTNVAKKWPVEKGFTRRRLQRPGFPFPVRPRLPHRLSPFPVDHFFTPGCRGQHLGFLPGPTDELDRQRQTTCTPPCRQRYRRQTRVAPG